MALIQSGWPTRQHNTATAGCAGVEVAQLFEIALPAAALVANDIIELGVLPAYNSISDAILVCDDLDTGGAPAMAFDVGIMSGEVGDKDSVRTCGAEIFAASNVGQAGGVARTTLASAFTIGATDKDRSIGVKITTAAATQAVGAKLRLLLKYRAV